jgi:hypothetical protein
MKALGIIWSFIWSQAKRNPDYAFWFVVAVAASIAGFVCSRLGL